MEDPVEQALRAADLLLQSSGFGMVVIDLAGVPLKIARRIPLTTWFRYRRAIENTPTALLVIGTQPCTESCASLSVQLRTENRELGTGFPPSHAELLTGMEIHAEILRSHRERKPVQSVSAFITKTTWAA
jgi:hypothetical protein